MKNGTTRVWARSGTDSVFAVVIVEQRPVKLAFNLGSPIVFDAIGASASLRADQRDARGNPVRGDFPISAAGTDALEVVDRDRAGTPDALALGCTVD